MELTAGEVLYQETIFEKAKKNKITSTVISVAVHLVVFGLVKTVHFSADKILPVEENYIDLGYERFDEVPEIVASQVPVAKSEPVIQEKSDPVATKSQEMQDQSSDVAGLQKEAKPSAVGSTNSNTTTVPYYNIRPKYPREALESNIEGHVLLKIDIEPDGSVDNIQVTGGEKTSVFETAAMRAVAKWKYKPFVDEFGQPTKKQNHLVRVDFKIKDEILNQ